MKHIKDFESFLNEGNFSKVIEMLPDLYNGNIGKLTTFAKAVKGEYDIDINVQKVKKEIETFMEDMENAYYDAAGDYSDDPNMPMKYRVAVNNALKAALEQYI